MKKITLQHLAAVAGCTVATASRALRGNTRISQETRDRVIQFAREMGYIPPPGQRVIAVISNLADFFPDYYTQNLLFLIARELRRKQFRCFVVFSHDLQLMKTLYLSGVISFMPYSRIARSWGAWSATPLVTVNDYSERSDQIFSVCSDETDAVTTVVRKLLACGVHHPGFFLSAPETYCSQMRREAYEVLLEQNGIVPRIFPVTFTPATAFEKIGDLTGCDSFILPGENLNYLAPILHTMMPDAMLAVWRYSMERHTGEICVVQDYHQLAKKAVDILEKEIAKVSDIRNEYICCRITDAL